MSQYVIYTSIHPEVLCQGLFGLQELGELELDCPACSDPPPGFHHKLKEDVKIARQFLSELRPPAGDFFISPDGRKRAGRPSNY